MTRKTALAFGIGASLILAAGTASADCATEVQALQDQLGMIDSPNARTGPTDPGVQQPDPSAPADMSATGTESTTGTDMSSTVGDESSPMTSSDSTADNEANATIGPTDPGVQQPDPGAETDMTATGETTTGTTIDPNDGSSVATEDSGGANATIGATDPGVQQPQNEDMDVTQRSGESTTVPSGTVGTGTVTETTRSGELTEPADSRSAALAALKKAELYADAGQEEACMSELSTAKQHMGVE